MAKQTIGVGSAANDGTGDTLRNAMIKINQNTDELYTDVAGITGLADNSVTTAKLVDGNVTAIKLASNAVTTTKILDGNVTATKLATNAVITTAIADDQVTEAKLAPAVVAQLGGAPAAPEGTTVLSTGEATATKFLREDGDGTCSWQTPAGAGDMLASSNLADLTDKAAARINLDVIEDTPELQALLADIPQIQVDLGEIAVLRSDFDDLAVIVGFLGDDVIDHRGAPYTVAGTDYGKVIIVDADLTLPVVAPSDSLRRVDVWAFGTVNILAASGDVTLTGGTSLADNEVASLVVGSSNGTISTWRTVTPTDIAAATSIEGTAVLSTGEIIGKVLTSNGADGVSWEDAGALAETNDLSASVTWVDVPDANITASAVQQHLTPETNDLSASVTWVDVPNANITASAVQQHLTPETNDLSASVTWVDVPDANITASAVQQHAMAKPSIRTTAGADTSSDADFGAMILMAEGHTVALHSTTDAEKIGQTITYRLRGATGQTISAGGAAVEGGAIMAQHETVTATLIEVGAGALTIYALTGGGS